MINYQSALDWSGDPGDPSRSPGSTPNLALVVVTFAVYAIPSLHDCLRRVRETRRLHADYQFHHVSSKEGVREGFFRELAKVDLRIFARTVDKKLWDQAYLTRTNGATRLMSELVLLIKSLPDDIVTDQQLLIDLERRDQGLLRMLRQEIRRTLAFENRRGFQSIKACPDHQKQGGQLVQVADMIAGEIRREGIGSPCLAPISANIILIE